MVIFCFRGSTSPIFSLHNLLKLSTIFSYSALPEPLSQNVAPHHYFARRLSWIICCCYLNDVKSDQRSLVMNGSVGKLKPIGERRSIIIPDNHLSRNQNLMGGLGSLGGMCAVTEAVRAKELSLPHLLKSFAPNKLFRKSCGRPLLLPSKPCYLHVITLDHLH